MTGLLPRLPNQEDGKMGRFYIQDTTGTYWPGLLPYRGETAARRGRGYETRTHAHARACRVAEHYAALVGSRGAPHLVVREHPRGDCKRHQWRERRAESVFVGVVVHGRDDCRVCGMVRRWEYDPSRRKSPRFFPAEQ